MRHGEFRHPRLVQVYDAECPWGPDDDLFRALVDETPGARVLDLGCGTGRLALALAAAGHTVSGVDPATASLDAARAKPGGERVTWIEGISALVPTRAYDVAVLTSHVAQYFVDDADWGRTLGDLHRALAPGGRLIFDARDPADRRWERWNPVDSRRRISLPDGGEVRAWTEVTGVGDGTVDFTHHYLFGDGEELLSSATLRFRTEAQLRDSLAAAGFAVDRIHGGWRREPVGQGDGEFVIVALAA
ncbi:class I SAM-dependent methyltransferase [Micromonospora sp. GCM10011542]|uniref:class I SAM-dependent methyltransferase n=1 Tax=Micromonospora sp. GCM10011542 TaxID=3317337 RepID=UPI003616A438